MLESEQHGEMSLQMSPGVGHDLTAQGDKVG